MKTTITIALLFAVSLPALAMDGISADIGLQDTIHGTLGAPGEVHHLRFFATAGTKVTATLVPEGTPDPGATLTLIGPGPIGEVLTVPGTYEYVVAGTVAGKYLLTVKGKAGKKVTIPSADRGAGESFETTFGAYAGSTMSFSLKGATATALEDPDALSGPAVSGAKGSKIALGKTGVWTFAAEGIGGPASGSITLKLPKVAKRSMWLSAGGFGPQPAITLVSPSSALQGQTAAGVEITGTDIDAAPDVRLVLGTTEVVAVNLSPITGGVRVDFPLGAAAPGKYTLRLTNPSGAKAETKFSIVNPDTVTLPDGVEKDTEVFYIEFTDDYATSLELFGLRSGTNATVDMLAAEAVATHALYLLRQYFLLDGITGELPKDGTVLPVSFVLGAPPEVVGDPGVAYNRIVVGGNVENEKPDDNANLNWGFTPVDAGNASFDDMNGENGTVEVGLAEMDPADTGRVNSAFRDAFAPLKVSKLSSSDVFFFRPWADGGRYYPKDAEIQRMGTVIKGVQRLSRELAGVLAHHIGRMLGLPNGSWSSKTPSGTPDMYGEFSSTRDAAFTAGELTTMAANINAHLAERALRGRSSPLRGEYFPLIPTAQQVLPSAETGVAYLFQFGTAGGRPDLEAAEVEWLAVSGTAPASFRLRSDGILNGKPEDTEGNQTFEFKVGAVDTKHDSDYFVMTHTLLVVYVP